MPGKCWEWTKKIRCKYFFVFLGAVYVQDQDRVIACQFSNAVSIQGRKGRLFDEFAKKLFSM